MALMNGGAALFSLGPLPSPKVLHQLVKGVEGGVPLWPAFREAVELTLVR